MSYHKCNISSVDAPAAGEGAGMLGRNGSEAAHYPGEGMPLDGLGFVGPLPPNTISPVYTLWCTLVFMYIGAHTHDTP